MSRNELHGPLAHPEPKRSGNEALGIHRGLDAIANLQLSEHLVDVLVDGVRGNVEVVRNLAVGQSTQDVAEYLQLPLRQLRWKCRRKFRVDRHNVCSSLSNRAGRLEIMRWGCARLCRSAHTKCVVQHALRASLPPAARRGRVAGNPFRRTSTWTGRIR